MGTYVIKDRGLYYWQRAFQETNEIAHAIQFGEGKEPFIVYKKELVSEQDDFVPFHGIMRLGVHMDGEWQYLYPKFTEGVLVEVLTEAPEFPDDGPEF